jgi:phasin family protein
MYPYPQEVTPAVRAHLDAQMAFINDLSKSFAQSFQNLCAANIQLSQALSEDRVSASQQLLTATNVTEAIAVAASCAQPISSKLQAYQQQICHLAADAQVELSRVSADHVQQTTRTAQSLAEEVARVAANQTEINVRQQEENLKNFRNPFEGVRNQKGNANMRAPGTMQSADRGTASMQSDESNVRTSSESNVQGSSSTPQSDKSKKHP